MAKGVKPTGLSNGVWNLNVLPHWEPMATVIDQLAFAHTNWKPAFQIIADKIGLEANRSIGSHTGPDGYGWRQLTEKYVNSGEKQGSRAMLVLSGKLKAAASPRLAVEKLTEKQMTYRVKSRYATAHQFGAHPTSAGHPGTRVRNYVIWGDDFKKMVFGVMQEYGDKRRKNILKGLK